MPIEFRCPQCDKLLRTPDEAAGKKAKCPQCEAIVDVPAGAAAPLPPPPPAAQPRAESTPDQANPFGEAAGSGYGRATSDAQNPYASPRPTSAHVAAPSDVQGGALEHRPIALDEALSKMWRLFSENLGQVVLPGLVLWGAWVALQIFGQVGNVVAQATGEPAIVGLFSVANGLLGFVVQIWMDLSIVCFMMKFAKTGRAEMSDFFNIGPYFARALAVRFLFGLICTGIVIACLLPAGIVAAIQAGAMGGPEPAVIAIAAVVGVIVAAVIIIVLTYRYYLWINFVFLVDRDQGVFESMNSSATFMAGNKLVVFAVTLIVGLVSGLFGCCTLLFGFILVFPYLGLMYVVLYLLATGQPIYEPYPKKQLA